MHQSWNPQCYSRNAGFVSALGAPLLELLKPLAGERVLDLGCGDGELTRRLSVAGCDVVGIDASAEMVAAASAMGVDARVADAQYLNFAEEFDAVFSNAALHWMRQQWRVVDSAWRALKPGGRFVGECGGRGNVATIIAALEAAASARRIDPDAVNPWYFPDDEEFRSILENQGFTVEKLELFSRPTPLPTDVLGWLETFAGTFAAALPAHERRGFLEEVAARCRDGLCDETGQWTADYVRLRFVAYKPRQR